LEIEERVDEDEPWQQCTPRESGVLERFKAYTFLLGFSVVIEEEKDPIFPESYNMKWNSPCWN
jgi:hypothetical protein